MKANAKKLLALIMAMVMCLSLAAPAMAAGADVVADASLSVQAVGLATSIALKSNAADGFTVVISGEGTRSYTWDSNGDEYVTVTKVGSEKGLVSQEAKMVYTAKLVASKASPTDVSSVSYTKTTAQLKLNDTSLTWEAVPAEATVKNTANKAYGRQGSFYQEEVEAGKWSYFWKLIPVKDNDFVTATKAADQKYVYAKSTGKAKLSTASEIKAALFASDMATYTDLTPTDAYATQSIAEKNGATTVADVATATTYTFTVADPNSVIGTSSNWTDSGSKLSVAVKKDGTFSVMATYTDLKPGTTETETKTVSDAAVMKSILDVTGTVESVTANSANASYFDVKVSTTGSAVTTEHTGSVGSKTSNYEVPTASGTKTLIGLTDTAEGGIYTDTNGVQKAINAGEKVYGPLVVTNDVSGLGSVKKGATYTDLAALKKAAVNESCKDSKKVEYKQLIMNAKVNGTANTGVVETKIGSNTYTLADGWEKKTDAQFEAGSLTVDPSAYHFYRKKTVKVPATCDADGSEIVVEACDVCGVEKAGTKKVTVLPKDTSEPVKTNKELGWVLKEKFTAAEYNKLPATVKSYYTVSATDPITLDPTEYTRVPTASLPGHYLAKVEVTNIKSGSKGQAGTYTATVYCNYGVAHITEERELEKDKLEHSGNWDNIAWSAQNSQFARNPGNLFGYRAVVADTDVDYPELAMTDSSFFQFDFDGTTIAPIAFVQDDGTYWNEAGPKKVTITSKDADGKKTTKNHWYYATVTVQDITSGAKDCQDGSANIVITVYEDFGSNATSTASYGSPKAVAKAVKDGKLVEKKTFTKAVVIPAQKSHVDANNDGKCDNCGTEINQTTPVNENTTDISKAVVKFGALTYTGKVAQPTVTVTLDGVELAKGIDYEVEEMQAVNAGTYYLVVKGKGDCTGRVVGTVTIKKAKNTIKVSKSTLTFKVKKLKKKAGTAALKVTKNKGKVSYKSSNKKVTWKSSKVTVAKKTKKGTYKLTFTAKGNSNYKAGSKTVKVVVK